MESVRILHLDLQLINRMLKWNETVICGSFIVLLRAVKADKRVSDCIYRSCARQSAHREQISSVKILHVKIEFFSLSKYR